MGKKPPSAETIWSAIQAVEMFCIEHGAELTKQTVVDITFAWVTGTDFQWTPPGKDFRRILFVDPGKNEGMFVKVFNNENFDEGLTRELNSTIENFTDGIWYE